MAKKIVKPSQQIKFSDVQKVREAAGAAPSDSKKMSTEQLVYSTKTPSEYGSGAFSKLELSPTTYPQAISHDPVFHSALHTHISELRSRIEGYMVGRKSTKAGKLDDVSRSLTKVLPHLTAAENAVNNSFSAHAAGFSDGVRAFHTANASYQRAIRHASDAARILNGVGPKHLTKIFSDNNWGGKVLTATQLAGLGTDYQSHLKSKAMNAKLALPSGVLTEGVQNTNPFSELSEDGKRLLPKPVDADKVEKNKVDIAGEKLRTRAQKGGRTFTAEEAERKIEAAKTGTKAKASENPWTGVGLTGFNDIAKAAQVHFEFNNPGKSFWHSGPSTEEHPSGSPISAKDVMDYATKHNVGVGNDYRQKLAETMRKVRLTPRPSEGKADITGQLISEKYTEEPETAPELTKARNRQAEFEGATGGKGK